MRSMGVDPSETAAASSHLSGPLSTSPATPRPAHITRPDALFGAIRISRWAATLTDTHPFTRLAGVSLSDVPGELLFGHPFSSRLDHALGVYHLARLARPRDRALQAAALAHDLGHGPFSHASETLMREMMGIDHEQRSVGLLAAVRGSLPPSSARLLSWLDWNEVARLILNTSPDGRGELLNGLLDYDNAEYVARFLNDAQIAAPSYSPATLARALRLAPTLADGPSPSFAANAVYLLPAALGEAHAWQADRGTLYAFLQEGHTDLALHAMLRKAMDLAMQAQLLRMTFFDLTDAEALRMLSDALDPQVARIARRVMARACYECVWEAEVPPETEALDATFRTWRGRLGIEARLAGEAGLAADELVLDLVTSAARRALPPVLGQSATSVPTQPLAKRALHLMVAPGIGRDYVRRLQMAAARLLVPMGASPREVSADQG